MAREPVWLREIAAHLPAPQILTALEDRIVYAYDATRQAHLPDLVVKARSREDVSALLRVASAHNVPVVPRGAGTGLSGGSVLAQGGIALVLSGMRRIVLIDRENMLAVVEPGVLTADLQKAVEAEGLFYPPDPSSQNYCTIGGNLAENAGGPRCVKYGVTKDYALGLEVVLADGRAMRTGGKAVKYVTGYNLTQLFIGSEGTLGVITEATLRLLPLPPARKTMRVTFARLQDAAEAVTAIMQSGVIPCTLELMDRLSINLVEDHLPAGLPREAEAMLIIESDGMPEAVEAEARLIEASCRSHRAAAFEAAGSAAEAEDLWRARRAVSPALSRNRRGKISLAEALLSGHLPPSGEVRRRLAACLHCLACAANCASGVPTLEVFAEAQQALGERLGRPWVQDLALRALLPVPTGFTPWRGGWPGTVGVGCGESSTELESSPCCRAPCGARRRCCRVGAAFDRVSAGRDRRMDLGEQSGISWAAHWEKSWRTSPEPPAGFWRTTASELRGRRMAVAGCRIGPSAIWRRPPRWPDRTSLPSRTMRSSSPTARPAAAH